MFKMKNKFPTRAFAGKMPATRFIMLEALRIISEAKQHTEVNAGNQGDNRF